MPALFLILFVVGLPPWLFVLYSTEQAITLLTSPGVWIACAVIWMIMSLSYVLADSD
jgi:hypothetical protein